MGVGEEFPAEGGGRAEVDVELDVGVWGVGVGDCEGGGGFSGQGCLGVEGLGEGFGGDGVDGVGDEEVYVPVGVFFGGIEGGCYVGVEGGKEGYVLLE